MVFHILVVEDDSSIANLIAAALQLRQYQVTIVCHGDEAARIVEGQSFDLVLLDVMLPGMDGYELLEIMKKKQIPVIFVSARGQLSDRVYGLSHGAEDYITKPFEPLELLARVEVVLRRRKPQEEKRKLGCVELDLQGRTVTLDGEPVELTRMEYDLLEFLMSHPNMVFSREKLLDSVWGYDYMGSTRTVDMHIKNLRSKLGLGKYIETVYKIGYKLTEKAED
ncbi:MAG: response regulator transcription factor [Eubacteriales bacterium]|nr:response regulator transcription factor [Eubacteriales bacterium]